MVFCLNSQTYLEKPEQGKSEDMFLEFIDHPIINQSTIIYKTNEHDFYNIGDWRRECYYKKAKYTIWGESDTLVPVDYFYILDELNINEPHVISLSSRKMWDDTWTIVEHEYLQNLERDHKSLGIYSCGSYINYQELTEFNDKFENIKIVKLPINKIDGSLLALSSNLPQPFISPNQHFVSEDTCAQVFFQKKSIPQYHITNKIKAHNYNHPLKRMNTKNTREDLIFKEYAEKSRKAMNEFLYG
jgi:hypothetical protein